MGAAAFLILYMVLGRPFSHQVLILTHLCRRLRVRFAGVLLKGNQRETSFLIGLPSSETQFRGILADLR